MLSDLLSAVGFIAFILGAASMDSEVMLIPAAMFILGLALLFWSANEDRTRRKRK